MPQNYLGIFEEYLKVRRLSLNTLESYLFDVSLFLKFEDFISRLSDLKLDDFRRYFASRQSEGIKASSNARAISAIKAFFVSLQKSGVCKNEEITKFTYPKLPKTLPKALNFDEIETLLEIPKEENWQILRDRALMTLIYATGLRISEALSLNKRDFGKNSDFIKVKGKGGKERIVPILKKAKEEVDEYLKLAPFALLPDYPLFIKDRRDKTGKPCRLTAREFQKVMQKRRTETGLPKFTTPHSLRHSFATHIIQEGGDIRSMQGLLGHTSLSTTQRYVKIDENLMRKAYEKFHPKSN